MPLYYKSGSSWVEFSSNPYPIGTLYYATKDVSPAPLVGGTWTKVITSSKEELVGYVAEAIEEPSHFYGYVSNYSFFHDGSKVTGTFTWNQGATSSGNRILLFSGLPTVSSSQTAGNISGVAPISIETDGRLILSSDQNLDYRRGYFVSISYTSNQMLGGHPSFTNELLNLFFGGGLDG